MGWGGEEKIEALGARSLLGGSAPPQGLASQISPMQGKSREAFVGSVCLLQTRIW